MLLVAASGAQANGLQWFAGDNLHLNTYETPNDGAAGPVTTDKPLYSGLFYIAKVKGTASLFDPSLWTGAQGWIVCGTPDDAPQYPSPGRPASKAGADAEYLFARPWRFAQCPENQYPLHYSNFEANVGAGYTHYEPVAGQPDAPAADHSYEYVLQGSGSPASFRLVESNTTDNNGVLKINVRPANPLDCLGSGWQDFGGVFADRAECIKYIVKSFKKRPWRPQVDHAAPLKGL